MREIKFRAWDKEELTMTPPELMSLMPNCIKSEDDLDVFMQYTGLKDKYSNEIYEGDIISQPYVDFGNNLSTMIGEVIYSRDSFVIDNKKDQTLEVVMGYCEVIGNIYENPELLK